MEMCTSSGEVQSSGSPGQSRTWGCIGVCRVELGRQWDALDQVCCARTADVSWRHLQAQATRRVVGFLWSDGVVGGKVDIIFRRLGLGQGGRKGQDRLNA